MLKVNENRNKGRLAGLLHSMTCNEFFQSYYEKKPFFAARGDRDFYDGLLPIDDLEEFISLNTDRVSTVNSLSEDGQRRGFSEGSKASFVEQVFEKLYDGYSIVLDGLQQRYQPMNALCLALQAETMLRCQTNIYITPPKARAFKLHLDNHDVFILQTHGSKTWYVDDTQLILPAKEDKYDGPDTLDDRTFTKHEMTQGDILYIPRGFLHRADSSDSEFSIHITLGMHPPMWSRLLHQLVDTAVREFSEMRSTMPMGEVRSDDPAVVKALVKKVTDIFDEDFIEREMRAFPGLWQDQLDGDFTGQFSSAIAYLSETDDKTYSGNGRLPIEKSIEEDELVLRFYGKEVRLPKQLSDVVDFCLTRQNYAAADVPELDDESCEVLIERLVREGIVLAHSSAV
jgi:ribosomal protein L16 Arg81 hydroxylase